ncbi:MAG: shikimate dehydrogenase [Pseudomonadota bacterium]
MADRQAFVIGDPIGHSKSPLIHGHWLEKHQLPGSYVATHVAPDALDEFLAELAGDPSRPGGNVTVPHKEAVFRWLSGRPEHSSLTDNARRLGAVNTLYRQGAQLIGDNTDGYGFLANLDAADPSWADDLSWVVVVGAGGASRAVVAALADRAGPGGHIHIANRTVGRATRLIEDLKLTNATAYGLTDLADLAAQASVMVNTSSLGMAGADGPSDLEQAAARLAPTAFATDIVYTPLMTPFLRAAQSAGARTVDGLGMLLHQAVPGFEAWFGVRPEVAPDVRNLVLRAMGLQEV